MEKYINIQPISINDRYSPGFEVWYLEMGAVSIGMKFWVPTTSLYQLWNMLFRDNHVLFGVDAEVLWCFGSDMSKRSIKVPMFSTKQTLRIQLRPKEGNTPNESYSGDEIGTLCPSNHGRRERWPRGIMLGSLSWQDEWRPGAS